MRSSAGLIILSAGLAAAAPFWMPETHLHRNHYPYAYPQYPHNSHHKGGKTSAVSSKHSSVHSVAHSSPHPSAHSTAKPAAHTTAYPASHSTPHAGSHSSATPTPYPSVHSSPHASAPASTHSSKSPSTHSSAHSSGHASSSAHPYSTGKPGGAATSKSSSATPSATPTKTPGGSGNSGLWQPDVGSSWQIVLSELLDASGTLEPDVDVFDIDMFDTPVSTIQQLQAKGKRVVCYFSAGSYEPGRPDSNDFTSSDLGSVMDGWPDEKWLDIRSTNVRNIMANRIKTAKSKGCDGIDPDNVDGYSNSNGLGLTEDDAYDFVTFLASTAASSGLSTGLKNANALVARVVDVIQYSINEQCHAYNECGDFQPFIENKKPVFNIEYPNNAPSSVTTQLRTQLCQASSGSGSTDFSTIMKTMDLDGWVELCNADTATTATSS